MDRLWRSLDLKSLTLKHHTADETLFRELADVTILIDLRIFDMGTVPYFTTVIYIFSITPHPRGPRHHETRAQTKLLVLYSRRHHLPTI
jgi:hypothetical protein